MFGLDDRVHFEGLRLTSRGLRCLARAEVRRPEFDPTTLVLRWGRLLVRAMKHAGTNQKRLVEAFEDAGWPASIPNLFPPKGTYDIDLEKNVVWFDSAFAGRGGRGGFGVALMGLAAKFEQAVHTDVKATHGVLVGAFGSTYQVTLNAQAGAAGQYLDGSLSFDRGAHLELLDNVKGTTGVFGITGNLTNLYNMHMDLNWKATRADVINVEGRHSRTCVDRRAGCRPPRRRPTSRSCPPKTWWVFAFFH